MPKDKEDTIITVPKIGDLISDGVKGFKKDLTSRIPASLPGPDITPRIKSGIRKAFFAVLAPATILEVVAIRDPQTVPEDVKEVLPKLLAFRVMATAAETGLAGVGMHFLKEVPVLPEALAVSVGLSLAYLGYIALDAAGAALVRRGGQK